MQTGKDQWSQVTTNGWHEFFTSGSQHVEHKHKGLSTASANCHMHPLSTQLEFSHPHDVVTKEFAFNISLLLETLSLYFVLEEVHNMNGSRAGKPSSPELLKLRGISH